STALPNLSQNRPRFGRRVGGFRDRAPYHDVRGSGGNRFRRSDDTRLIVGSSASKAHSGRDNGEIVAKLLAQSSGLLRRSHHALASVRERQGGQPQDLIEHSSAQANLAQIVVVQAGQHRDRQDEQVGVGRLRGVDG